MKLANNIFCKVLSFASFLLLFVSCTKHSADTNIKVANLLNVTSVSGSLPSSHEFTIDSFNYDINGRLARYRQWGYDSSYNPQLLDSFDLAFSFNATSSTVPSSYTLHSMNAGTNNPEEYHALYYDSQGRIIKDSMLNAPFNGTVINNSVVTNYRYSGNIIICEQFQNGNSGLTKAVADSLFMSAEGNLTNNNWHFSVPGAIADRYQTYTFSNYANPLYNKTIATGVGPLFLQIFGFDFISNDIFNSHSFGDLPSQNLGTYRYTWIPDTKGRVVKNQPVTYPYIYTFHYSN